MPSVQKKKYATRPGREPAAWKRRKRERERGRGDIGMSSRGRIGELLGEVNGNLIEETMVGNCGDSASGVETKREMRREK